MTVVAALLAAVVIAVLGAFGTGEAGVLQLVRWTARLSLLLLCLALLHERGPARLASWARFPDVVRGLALSHAVHALAVFWLAAHRGGANLVERGTPVAVLGGALAYVFIFWAALRPHSKAVPFGLAWVWTVFMASYGTRALRAPLPFAVPVVLLAAAMAAHVLRAVRPPRAARA